MLFQFHYILTFILWISTSRPTSLDVGPPRRQFDMIREYVSHALSPKLAIERSASNLSNGRTIQLTLRALYERVDKIVRCCSPQYATFPKDDFDSCFLLPCGVMAGIANGYFHKKWKLSVPKGLAINTTVLEVSSKWGGDFCLFTPTLTLPKRSTYGHSYFGSSSRLTKIQNQVCAKSLPEGFFQQTNEQWVIWESTGQIEEKASFLLSYQALFPGYVKQQADDFTRKLCTFQSRKSNCIAHQTIENTGLWPFRRWRDQETYVWFSTGLVWKIPRIKIITFKCLKSSTDSNSASTAYLTVYDAPLIPRDPAFAVMNTFPKSTQVCSNEPLEEIYKSSIGDLTLLVSVKRANNFAPKALLSLARCSAKFCKHVVRRIYPGMETIFSLSSLEMTSQHRLLLMPSPGLSYLVISDLYINVEGYTHLLCTIGGIFIYHLNPLSLIAQICSSFAANVWSGSVEQKDGTVKLYLNEKPVIFIIKSYSGMTSGSVSGVASLQDRCVGFVNPEKNEPHHFTPRHAGNCEIRQYLYTGQPRTRLGGEDVFIPTAPLSFTQEFEEREVEYTLSALRNKTASIADSYWIMVVSGLYETSCEYYILIASEIRHLIFKDLQGNYQTFRHTFRPTTPMEVYFSRVCLRFGFQTVLTRTILLANAACVTSDELRDQITTRFDQESYTSLPAVPCGVFNILYGDLRRTKYLSLIFTRPEFQKGECCIIVVSALNSMKLYFVSMLSFSEATSLWLPKEQELSNIPVQKHTQQRWMCIAGDRCHILTRVTSQRQIGTGATLHHRALLNALHGRPEMEVRFSLQDKRHTSLGDQTEALLKLQFVHKYYQQRTYLTNISGIKHAWAGDCYEVANIQYCFTLQANFSWTDTVKYCSSHGMQLLTTPSDIEWSIIRDIFFREGNIMLLSNTAMVCFLGLERNAVRILYFSKSNQILTCEYSSDFGSGCLCMLKTNSGLKIFPETQPGLCMTGFQI